MPKHLKLTIALVAAVMLVGLAAVAGSGGAWLMAHLRALHGH